MPADQVQGEAGPFKDIWIARQPIFTAVLDVYGYELLYRDNSVAPTAGFDGNRATSQVLLNAFVEIGLEALVGKRRAFVNLTANFFAGQWPIELPTKQVVLEVLEDVQPTAAVIAALRELVARGYIIALDDFVYRRELQPLIELAHIIKVDVLQTPPDVIGDHVAHLRESSAKLLAEKVETQEVFNACRMLGFDLYQGYFFARPSLQKGRSLPPNRVAILRLLAKLYDPKVEVHHIERLVSQDVALCYKLLKYINSPYFGLRQKISSIQQALVYLGLKALKMWVTLISLSGIDDKPGELIITAMVRAKMCEDLAVQRGLDKDICFTIGLFSMLDAIFDAPMNQIVTALPLADEVKRALLHYEGAPGAVLKAAVDFERGDWDANGQRADTAHYVRSIKWANDTAQGLLT